jgi:hypothetical protein
MGGMTAVAECDQVGGVIVPASGAWDQVVDVSFAIGAWFATSLAKVGVTSQYNGTKCAPPNYPSLAGR